MRVSSWHRAPALVIGAVVALTLAACGTTNSASTQKVTISFWYMPNGTTPKDYVNQEIAAFNAAHPNITVQPTLVDWGQVGNKMNAVLAGGQGPDVTQVGTTLVGTYSKAFHSFTQSEINGLGGKGAFTQATWTDTGIYGSGKTTAVPWFIDTRAVYYRKDILQKDGVDPASAFQNWSSFEAALAKIKAAGDNALGMPSNDWNVIHNMSPWIWEAGGDYLSSDGSKPVIAEDAAVNGVYQWQRIAGTYVDPAILQKNSADMDAYFAQGKFAITISGPWLQQQLQDPGPNGVDSPTSKAGFGTAAFPSGPDGKRFVFFGGSNLAILKASKHNDAAYEFVRWLTSDAGQKSYIHKIGMYPSRAGVGDKAPFSNDTYLTAFAQQMKDGKSYPLVTAWGPIESTLSKDFGTLWQRVSQHGGPLTRSQVKGLLQTTAQDMSAAIQNAT
jgi:multiple sugar transport system substrate-binding protein